MEKLKINPNNKKYYSDEFIKGFECGVERQFNVDMVENTMEQTIEEFEKIKEELITKCNHCNCESCVFASLKDEKCLMKTIINNHISGLKGGE